MSVSLAYILSFLTLIYLILYGCPRQRPRGWRNRLKPRGGGKLSRWALNSAAPPQFFVSVGAKTAPTSPLKGQFKIGLRSSPCSRRQLGEPRARSVRRTRSLRGRRSREKRLRNPRLAASFSQGVRTESRDPGNGLKTTLRWAKFASQPG